MEAVNASILYEMPYQKRDEGLEIGDFQERETSNSGNMSRMWDEDV